MSDLPHLPSDASAWIRTARLDLEPMLRGHAEEMLPVLSDLPLYELTGGAPPASVESLADQYARRESRRSHDGNELWLNWLVRVRDGRAAVGYVQATIAPAVTHVAWLIGTRWQGRGFASEAARALISWLDVMGAPNVRACVHPRHAASQRVAHHAGLRRTEHLSDIEEVWMRMRAESNRQA